MAVIDVRTMTMKSKPKRRGWTAGRTRGWKKAIVELAPGDRIELFEGAADASRRPSNDGDPQAQADHRPARRFATWLEREELTRSKPEKSLVKGKSKSGGRNTHGRITSRHRGGGAKRRYRAIDFKRRKDGVPAKVAAIEYDPNRSASHRAAALPRRREALHPCAPAADGRHGGRLGRECRHPGRQLAAAGAHPDRNRRAQRRADARPRRAARPLGGRGDPARREGGPQRDAAPPLRRDAHGAGGLPRDDRHRSATPTTRTSRSARRGATGTAASARRRAAPR